MRNLDNANKTSRMNNLISLNTSGLINTKNKTITGERFYVGEGILKCDNYFISLDSICIVEIGRRQKSDSSYISTIIIGIVISIFSLMLFNIDEDAGMTMLYIGGSICIFGALGLFFNRKSNEKIPYSLSIQLNNNYTCTYYSLDKGFILDIMEVIQSCINDRRGVYSYK